MAHSRVLAAFVRQWLHGRLMNVRPAERAALERCQRQGAAYCEWCPRADECAGPFPFVTGWLITLSRPLAKALATSTRVAADVQKAFRLNRTEARVAAALRMERLGGGRPPGTAPILEDIWLGSVVHRFLSASLPITVVQMDSTHFFNGNWPARCQRLHVSRRCGYEWNTTIVYHHKEPRAVHRHVQSPWAHEQSRPAVQCSDDSQGARYRYLLDEMHGYRRYVKEHGGSPDAAYCVVFEPRFLQPPKYRRLVHSGWV